MSKYIDIDQPTGLNSCEGDCHSYHLVAGGSTPTEILENAFVVEVDDAGNEHTIIELGDCDERLFKRCCVIIGFAWVDSDEYLESEAA